MKNRFILLLVIAQVTGCSVLKPGSRNTDNLSVSPTGKASDTRSNPVFIQNISTVPGDHSSGKYGNGIPVKNSGSGAVDPGSGKPLPHPVGTDDYNQLKFKYS